MSYILALILELEIRPPPEYKNTIYIVINEKSGLEINNRIVKDLFEPFYFSNMYNSSFMYGLKWEIRRKLLRSHFDFRVITYKDFHEHRIEGSDWPRFKVGRYGELIEFPRDHRYNERTFCIMFFEAFVDEYYFDWFEYQREKQIIKLYQDKLFEVFDFPPPDARNLSEYLDILKDYGIDESEFPQQIKKRNYP